MKDNVVVVRRGLAAVLAAGLALGGIAMAPLSAVADELAPRPQSEIGYPTFNGSDNPVPDIDVDAGAHEMMADIYQEDLETGDGTEFWMDRMLRWEGTRSNTDDTVLLTRGRAFFMMIHDPSVLGFGGHAAWWDTISEESAYVIDVGGLELIEDGTQRVQTPSHFTTTFSSDDGLEVEERKYVTHNNVAVTELTFSADTAREIPLVLSSPYTTTVDGDELTGALNAKNNITTLFPRLSGDGFEVDGDSLARTVAITPGEPLTVKAQLGFVTQELPESRTEYDEIRTLDATAAFTDHVQTYNKWWADNLPYIDTPNDNVDKAIYYRWFLLRFNSLDAQIPGNYYQFPTTMEGVLGYNNAIDLTVGMFISDTKYFRDPAYSYGTWLQAGEVAQGGAYRDNPGDPQNWSMNHTQFISEQAWQSYQLHGGPEGLAQNLAKYSSGDVKGTLEKYDSNDNGVVEISSNAWTGNDGDAVSFDHPNATKPVERTESAYLYSNALASAEAYELLGDEESAAEMRALAQKVQAGVLGLWNEDDQVFEHRGSDGTSIPWKEINNYYPYSTGLVPTDDPKYHEAFKLWADANQFPVFPFYTANQLDKADATAAGKPGTNNFSIINSQVTFRMLSAVLRDYQNEYIGPEFYRQLLEWNAFAQYVDGDNQWLDSNEFWSNWNEDSQSIDYRSWIHHTILGTTNWTVIEDVAGITPRTDDLIELDPIDIDYDYFAVTDVRMRDRDVSVIWNDLVDGELAYPDLPEGYSLFVDGELALTLDQIGRAVYDPATGEVTELAEDVTVVASADVGPIESITDVTLSDTRVPQMLQLAGHDVEAEGGTNLALEATPSASFTASDTSIEGAVDGYTIDSPHWGTAGSPSASDWYALDFREPTTVDDVKLYFYTTERAGGYDEPAQYRVEYRSGDSWLPVEGVRTTPTYPVANYNRAQFVPVTTDAIRVVFTHRAKYATALKEIQVFDSGQTVEPADNAAPWVIAWQDASYTIKGKASLIGRVLDDGLPAGKLDVGWEVAEGPGEVIFQDASASSTIAEFTEPGTYVLNLAADDGEKSGTASVTIEAEELDTRAVASTYATPSAYYNNGNAKVFNDGIEPTSAAGTGDPVWTNYGGQYDSDWWIQYDWDKPVTLSSSDIYFVYNQEWQWDPSSLEFQYWDEDSESFQPVEPTEPIELKMGEYTTASFEPVTTTKFRAIPGKPTYAEWATIGVQEWKVFTEHELRPRPVALRAETGVVPDLPETVEVTGAYADGSSEMLAVAWPIIAAEDVAAGDTSFAVDGEFLSQSFKARAVVYVRDQVGTATLNAVDEIEVATTVGLAPFLPSTVVGVLQDGSRDSTVEVSWEPVAPEQYEAAGWFTVTGTVTDERYVGTTATATAVVTVVDETEVPGVEVSIEPVARCVAGRVVIAARLSNASDVEVSATTTSDYGTNTTVLGPGRSKAVAFSARLTQIPAGQLVLEATTANGDQVSEVAHYDAFDCTR